MPPLPRLIAWRADWAPCETDFRPGEFYGSEAKSFLEIDANTVASRAVAITIMNPYLMPTIEFGPIVVQRLIGQIPESQWDTHVDPDRFTLREAVAHLADWEQVWVERIRMGLDSPGATIVVYDETDRASEFDYVGKNPRSAAADFAANRRVTADLVRGLTPDQMKLTVNHPERGTLTVEDMTNMILGHDLFHIEHLTQYVPDKVAATW